MTLYDEHTWGAFASVAAPDVALHPRAVEPQVELRLRRGDGDPRRARPRGALAGGRAGRVRRRGPLQPRRPRATRRRTRRAAPRSSWCQHAPVAAHRARRGARGPRRRRARRDARACSSRATCRGVARAARARGACGRSCRPSAARGSRSDGGPAADDLSAGGGRIENEHYRIEVDPATGGLRSCWTRRSGTTSPASSTASGSASRLRDGPGGTGGALFAMDFSREDFGLAGVAPFRRRGRTRSRWASRRSSAGGLDRGRGRARRRARRDAAATGSRAAAGPRGRLAARQVARARPRVGLHRLPVRARRAPLPRRPQRRAVHPGRRPAQRHVRDWYPLRRWADVSDGERGVTLAPLDAPLVQLGGITTGRPRRS